MSRYELFNTPDDQVENLKSLYNRHITEKYYNKFMSKYSLKGLDEEVEDQQEHFIFDSFWKKGKVAAIQVKNTEMLAFSDFTDYGDLNIYNYPDSVQLQTERNVSEKIIPKKPLVINKEVVIGFCMPSRDSVYHMCKYYFDALTEVECVINTNLNAHKMPYLIACSEKDVKKFKTIINKILNNKPVIYTSLADLRNIQVLATNTPYIIDKLQQHKRDLENALLTLLGIDNNATQQLEQTHITTDAVNANNEEINNCSDVFTKEINKFLKNIERIFNRKITLEYKKQEVKSIHEEGKEDETTEIYND